MPNLVLWQPHSPLLEAYAILARQRARHERGRYARLRDQANDVLWAQYAQWPDLEQKIVSAMDRIRLRQEGGGGTPMTEWDDGEASPTTGQGTDSHAERMGRAFLLKKAWKQVRTLCHPDKNRGSAEEFAILADAYRAGDLDTLSEYVLSINQTIMEQIAYWLMAGQKPAIEWQILQHMPMFRVVRAVAQGNHELASRLALQLRLQRLRELEAEELMMG